MKLALPFLCACALSCQTVRPILAVPRGSDAAPRAVLFENVRIFDGRSDALSPPSDLLIDGGRIAAIALHGQLNDPRATGAGTEQVDGSGRTLLPGLIDCHVHLGGPDGAPPWAAKVPNLDAQAAALVYSGVTTILSAARDTDLIELRARLLRGDLSGPRIIGSSRAFTLRGGHPVPLYKAMLPWPISAFVTRQRVVQIESAQEVKAAVDAELEDGAAAFVKIMYDDIPPGAPRLSRELLAAIIAEVRAKGRRASVHVGSPQDAIDAVEAGASLLMHVPSNARLSEEETRKLAASGVPLVSTVGSYGVIVAGLRGTLSFSPLEKEVMPPGTEKAFAEKPENYQMPGFPQSYLELLPERARIIGQNALQLWEAGATLLAGTDSGLPGVFHGAALHRELRALVALGIPPARVLRMATADAAQAIDPQADYGSISPGMRADLLLIEGDPLAEIANTERIAGVWQDGRKVARVAPARSR